MIKLAYSTITSIIIYYLLSKSKVFDSFKRYLLINNYSYVKLDTFLKKCITFQYETNDFKINWNDINLNANEFVNINQLKKIIDLLIKNKKFFMIDQLNYIFITGNTFGKIKINLTNTNANFNYSLHIDTDKIGFLFTYFEYIFIFISSIVVYNICFNFLCLF